VIYPLGPFQFIYRDIPPRLSSTLQFLSPSAGVPGRSDANLAGFAGGGRRRRGASVLVVCRSSSFHRQGLLPGWGYPGLSSQIWILGISLLLLWLRWLEQGAVEMAVPPLHKQAAGSFLALSETEPCLLPPVGRGGEERKSLALVAVGSGRRGSSSASVHVTGGRPSPSSPLMACK
jgi:hypothetical protein